MTSVFEPYGHVISASLPLEQSSLLTRLSVLPWKLRRKVLVIHEYNLFVAKVVLVLRFIYRRRDRLGNNASEGSVKYSLSGRSCTVLQLPGIFYKIKS